MQSPGFLFMCAKAVRFLDARSWLTFRHSLLRQQTAQPFLLIGPGFQPALDERFAQRSFSMTYNIGEKLKTLRKAKNLTLKQVSAATGFSLALISQVENNNITPPIPTLAKLARFYRVQMVYFFTEEGDKHCA
jgi:hypothetical protein